MSVSFSAVTSGSLSNSSHSTSKVVFVFSSSGVCIVLSFLKSPNSCFKIDFKSCFSSLIAFFRARKKAIKEEKQDLKSILKQEFGLFKKDSTIQTPDEEKTKTTFEVEWDEFDNEPDVTAEKETDKTEEKKKKDKNKGLNKFLKKIGVEEVEKKKVEIEIEG